MCLLSSSSSSSSSSKDDYICLHSWNAELETSKQNQWENSPLIPSTDVSENPHERVLNSGNQVDQLLDESWAQNIWCEVKT